MPLEARTGVTLGRWYEGVLGSGQVLFLDLGPGYPEVFAL